jgi:hypothetical protein
LVLGSDTRYCNADTLGLAALEARIPVEIETTAYRNPGELRRLLTTASFFAYVEGAADSGFNPLGRLSIAVAATDPRYRQLAVMNLPDGSRLHVLVGQPPERAGPVQAGTLLKGDMDALPACSVKFSDEIELVGLSLGPAPGGVEARYRWRCTRRMARNYWSFGHVLDSSGKVVGYLDHAILQNSPTSEWEEGDSAIEKVIVPLSGGVTAVRLGVFDRQSGERLTIRSSSFPLADSGTATVAPVR